MYLTSPIQDNSRKRRSSDASLANGYSSKRFNVDTTYNAFTEEQHAVIADTASFFQIHPSDLAAAIGSIRRSSVASPYDHRPSYANYFQHSTSYYSSSSEDSFRSQAAMRNEWETTNGSSRDMAFGFGVLPASTWSTCFSNMLATDEEEPKIRSTDTQSTYTGNRNPEALISATSQHDALLPTYPDVPFDPTMYNSRKDQGRQEAEDTSLCSSMFACNTPFQFQSPWQPALNDFSKPPVPQPSMTYSRQRAFIPSNHNLSPPRLDLKLLDPIPDAQQTNQEKASPSWDRTPLECPLIDFSIEDDSSRPKRGPFKDPLDKAQTAQTRKDNACVRCKMQRTRCIPNPFDPRGVCLTCKKVANTRVVSLPCLRYKVLDARLFREGYVPGLTWSNRWDTMEMNDVSTWYDSEIRRIKVTQDYSPNPIVLQVRKFIPIEGDKLFRTWDDAGNSKSAKIPPYAIDNLKEAERSYRDFISREGMQFFISTLDRKDALVFETYTMAIKASKCYMSEQERVLLNMVIRLWVAARMLCKSEKIVGDDRLGMSPYLMDGSSRMPGLTPIPPVMSAQIEVILIQGIMKPLRTMVLEQLQKLILAHKPQNWFCIYLCTFMLLHSASLITKADIKYAEKHGIKRKFAMPTMIAELHMGANILLAYFHYACRGQSPFTLDWDAKDIVSMAVLDVDQVSFIKRTALHVEANASKHREIQQPSSCDHPHYFISQLYEKNWEPRSTSGA